MSRADRSFALVALSLAAIASGACSSASSSSPPASPPCDVAPSATAAECAALHATLLPIELPKARGNRFGDDENAALFGHRIFFDARFSKNQEVRCATCHLPESHFQDAKPLSLGLSLGDRNAPTVLNAARQRWLFWDGRADTLWSQPLFAFENPKEMGFSRVELARAIAAIPEFAATYASIFGPLPDFSDARWPLRGAPGDPEWEAMSDADREAIDRVVSNLGKALEAYVRRVATGRSAWDRFLLGDGAALGAAEKRGVDAFVKGGCLGCHAGPTFSDDAFHVIGVPGAPDEGRARGLRVLSTSAFGPQSPFFDGEADPGALPAPAPGDVGAFRTPSLRNVALSAPYGHDGAFATLREIVELHLAGGGKDHASFTGEVDPLLVARTLSTDELADLLAFLGALNGDYPSRPWNDWPDR